MKAAFILFFSIVLLKTAYGQGDAPSMLQGQYQTSKAVGATIQVANSQVTKINSSTALLETTNNNLLINSGFEHQTYNTSWTVGAGTPSEETSVVFKGKKAFKIVLASQTLSVTQDSTTYAGQYADGTIQGLAYARVKTSAIGVRVCPRLAGTTQTNLCVTHSGSGKWEFIKIPFVLGATSQGITINTASAISGTVYIDDTFLGPVDLSATQSFDTTCDTEDCQTVFSAKLSSTATISAENVDFISSASNTATGNYTVTFTSGRFTTTPNCVASVLQPSGTRDRLVTITSVSTSQILIQTTVGNGDASNQAFNLICERSSTDYIAALQAQKDYQKTKISSYSADCGVSCVNTYSAEISSTGVVSQENVDWINDPVTVASTSNFTITLNSGVASVPMNCSCTVKDNSSTAGSRNCQIKSSSSTTIDYLTDVTSAGTTALSARAVSIICQKQGADYVATRSIVGSFSGLEKCATTLDCTDTFSFVGNASATVSNENVEFINGNGSVSNTSQFTYDFVSGIFSQAPNCVCSSSTSYSLNTQKTCQIVSVSTSQVSVFTSANDVNAAHTHNVVCQKQGSDYVGNTAKAVASDQNLRTPGVVNAVLCSAQVSSTGVLSNQYGGCFSSCTNATTPVCTFTSNYWLEEPNCWSKTTGTGLDALVTVNGTTSMSGAVSTTAGSAAVSNRAYFCTGIKK